MSTELDVAAKPGRHLLATTLAITALAGAAPPAEADTFIKFEGIKGESVDSKHKDEVDVLAWSWGVVGVSPDAKGKTQAACAEQMTLTKYVDRSTPPLFTAAALGSTIASARLTVRKSGEGATEYLVIDLGSVTVRSLAQSSGGDSRVVENVSLAFTTAKISYSPQNLDGSAGSAVTAFVPAACP